MTKETSRVFRFLGFVIPSSFAVRASSVSGRSRGSVRKEFQTANSICVTASGFTVMELLVVITIIIMLAGLILATFGHLQKKGARSRAEAEIAAISAALESYKADNGIYPTNDDTNNLNARVSGNPTTYPAVSLFLYHQLSATNPDGSTIPGTKSYLSFKPNMLRPHQSLPVTAIVDPFGNSYGYSTAYQSSASTGYNPTFDLWSTGGTTSANNPPNQTQWIKNW